MPLFIQTYVILFYIVLAVELIFFPVKSNGSTFRILKEEKTTSSKKLFYLTLNLFVVLIIIYPMINLLLIKNNLTTSIVMIFFGALFIAVGRWQSLGAMLQLRENREQLHTDRFFRFTRNPNIDGTIFFLLGLWMLMPTILFLLVIIFVHFYFISRANREEHFLTSQFGKTYYNYKSKVKKSIFSGNY